MTPRSDWAIDRGREFLAQATESFAHVLEQHGLGVDTEAEARELLRLARRAMDWLEDDPAAFDEAHKQLDSMGRWVRVEYGCTLSRQGTRYSQGCPVWLAHLRAGFSPAMIIGASECSICAGDYEACQHVAGVEYDGEVCVREITNIEAVLEVSLVDRPSQPDARIEMISITHDDLREALGDDWEPGVDVSCDRCLGPCPGLRTLASA